MHFTAASERSRLPIQTPECTLEKLVDALDPVTPTFVLIDPLLGEPIPNIPPGHSPSECMAARVACWDREVIQVTLSPRTSLPIYQHPYFLRLDNLDDPLLGTTFGLAQGERTKALGAGLAGAGMAPHRIGGWIQSTMQHDALASGLSTMCTVNTSVFTMATYLRLADRRTLALLAHVIGRDRVKAMLGRLQRWCYLDFVGEISVLNGQINGDAALALRLNKQEWELMERGELVNRTLGQWLGQLKIDARPAVDVNLIHERALAAVETAKKAARRYRHRFPETVDVSSFAALCIMYPDLVSDDVAARLLADHGTSDEPAVRARHLHPTVEERLFPFKYPYSDAGTINKESM